jgi:hypothetical protein
MSALVGSGGAGSPEAAVRQLAKAVSHEDPLAAADVLAPNELRTLHATVDKAQRKAAEKQLVESASAPLEGVDFEVDDVQLTTTELADGFVKVTVTGGRFAARTTKEEFSPLLQKAMEGAENDAAELDLANADGELFGGMPTFVVTVRVDGDWYVSAAYTALEYIREYNDLPAGDFGSGLRTRATLGADSPDAAVQEAVRATQQNDWMKLLSLVPPDEIPAYDYRDALIALAEREDARTEFSIDNLTTESEIDGDHAFVTLHAAGTAEGGAWSIDGGCYTSPEEFAPTPDGGEAVPVRYCVADAPLGLYDLWGNEHGGPSQITTVRRDGRWFVSPTGTALDVLDHWVDSIDDRALYTILDMPEAIPPHGAISLGETVVVPAERGIHVYTFEGRRGQQLLGLQKSAASGGTATYDSTWTTMLDASGKRLDNDSLFYGEPTELPADGTYLLAVHNYSGLATELTIWNAQDAPEEARQGYSAGFPDVLGAGDCDTASVSPTSVNGSGQASVQVCPPRAPRKP